MGYTSNPINRLQDHNGQVAFNTFSSKVRPGGMAALFECGPHEKEAIQLERFIKKQHCRQLLEQLLQLDFIPAGKLAQLVIP